MFESTATARTRDAIRAAHAERGAIVSSIIRKLLLSAR